MKMIFMENDPEGGVVYVGKNELCLHFSNFSRGAEDKIQINTRELMQRLWSKNCEVWETEDWAIEPRYCCPDGVLLVIITAKFSKHDCDKAAVYREDLVKALEEVECIVYT